MEIQKRIYCIIFLILIFSVSSFAQVTQSGDIITATAKSEKIIKGATVSMSVIDAANGAILYLDDKIIDTDGTAEFGNINFQKIKGFKILKTNISTYGYSEDDEIILVKRDSDGGIFQIMADTKNMPEEYLIKYMSELYGFFGIDEKLKLIYDEEYILLSEKIKNISADSEEEYKKLLSENIILINVKNRLGSQLLTLFESLPEIISELTYYNNLTSYQKEILFRNIAGKSYDSVDAMIAELNSNILTFLTPIISGPVISGGSLSGGGGSGSSATVVHPQVVPEPENNFGRNEEKEKISYTDMEGAKWAEEAVNNLTSLGIINGYEDNSFRPDNNVTRAEFLKMLVQITGISESKKVSFYDVNEDEWFYSYVIKAFEAGFAQGYNKYFYPNNAISRQDMCVMCMNVLKYYDFQVLEAELNFTDKDTIADYADSSLQTLYEMKIINGMPDGNFYPLSTATRAEAANIIYKLWNILEGI